MRSGLQLEKTRNARKTEESKKKQALTTKKTNLEKYGVENVFQCAEIKDKIKKTNLEKYGVENAMQSGLFENGYKWKNYTLPSGDVIKIQGYENKLLDILLETFNEEEIITKRSNMPEFWYTLNGAKRRYFPDVFIPITNTIYEVKSEYTAKQNIEMNNKKFQSVKDAGYNFELLIFD